MLGLEVVKENCCLLFKFRKKVIRNGIFPFHMILIDNKEYFRFTDFFSN